MCLCVSVCVCALCCVPQKRAYVVMFRSSDDVALRSKAYTSKCDEGGSQVRDTDTYTHTHTHTHTHARALMRTAGRMEASFSAMHQCVCPPVSVRVC